MKLSRAKTPVCWWKQAATRGADGAITFEAPIELRSHWEARREQVITDSGAESISTSIAFIPIDCFETPESGIAEGDFIIQSALEDLTPAQRADPRSIPGAQAVKVTQANRTVNGDISFWKVQQ